MSEYLRCDAPGCSHREAIETITEDMIGKRCPVCGADLLTKDDYEIYVASVRPAIETMIALGLAAPAPVGTPKGERISVNWHDGNLRVGFPKKPEDAA